MSRCIICDYSSDLSTGPKRTVSWNDKEKGFVCSDCSAVVFDNWTELRRLDKDPSPGNGDLPLLEFEIEDANNISVEGLDILEEFGVEEDQAKT